MKFSKDAIAYESINPNDASSNYAPVFTDKMAAATGIMNVDAFTNPKSSKKFGTMIQLALQQAYASPDFKGCCGSVLTFVCNVLDRRTPNWEHKKTMMGDWWSLYKRKKRKK